MLKKIKELKNYDKKYDELFPVLDESTFKITDIVYFMTFIFTNADDDYKENLKSVLKMKNIILEDEYFEEVHTIVFPFLKFINTFV